MDYFASDTNFVKLIYEGVSYTYLLPANKYLDKDDGYVLCMCYVLCSIRKKSFEYISEIKKLVTYFYCNEKELKHTSTVFWTKPEYVLFKKRHIG